MAESLLGTNTPQGDVPPPVRLQRHAHIVLFGDFLGPLAQTDAAIARLAGGGARGQIVQIADPAEENLPYAGRTRFEGLENEGDMLVARVEAVRDDYRAVYADHVAGLRAIARARVYVDTYGGALKEAGDIVQPIANGTLQEAQIAGDLGELAQGRAAGRSFYNQITLFKSVGTALEDLAAAELVFEGARS